MLDFGNPTTSNSRVARVSLRRSVLTITGVARGSATVGATASDGNGGSATTSGPVTVPNRPPEPVGRISDDRLEVGQSGSVDVSSKFRDPDGDPLTYTVVSSNSSVVGVSVSGSDVTYEGNRVGSATVTVTATDDGGLSATQSFGVTVRRRNEPPRARAGSDQRVYSGETVTLDGSRSSDSDGTIDEWRWTGPLALENANTARASFEAPYVGEETDYRFELEVEDDDEATDTDRVTVTVEPCPAPDADAGRDQTARESRRVTLNGGGSTDAASYSWRQTRGPSVTLSGANTAVPWFDTPLVSADVVLRFRLTVTSDCGSTDTDDVRVTVRNNGPPEPVGTIPAQRVDQGATGSVRVSGYFSDPENDALTYTAVSSDTQELTVSVSGDRVSYEGLWAGVVTVTVTARDGYGETAEQRFEVTVEDPNDAPEVVSAIPAMTVAAGTSAVVDVSGHFRDPNGDALTYRASSSNKGAATVGVRGSDVTVTGVFRGESQVTVTARDVHGASVSQDFTVTVPNRAPAAVGTIPAQTVVKGATGSVSVSSKFRDPDGDALTYSAVSSDSQELTVSVSGARVSFEGLWAGTVTVTVTANDGYGGTAEQRFEVTVEDPNDAPEVLSAIPAMTVAAGTSAVVDVPGHFRDPNGDALTYGASSSNEGAATVTVSGNELTVTGVSRGESQVTVTARDVHGASVSQDFTVTVPNRAPAAVGELGPVTVHRGGAVTVEVAGAFSDPDSDVLSYVAVSSNEGAAAVSVSGSEVTVPNRAPAGVGSLTNETLVLGDTIIVDAWKVFEDADGDALAYTASSTAEAVVTVGVRDSTVVVAVVGRGHAEVRVRATDPAGLWAEQAFTVTVRNRAPEAVGEIGPRTVGVGERWTLALAAYFQDGDNDALTYTAVTSDAGVAAASVDAGELAVTGVAKGRIEVTVTASDGYGGTADQAFVVTVPNRAPAAVSSIGARSVTKGAEGTVDVEPYFEDPDGDDLAYAATSSNDEAVSVSASGSEVRFRGESRGSTTVTVRATDDEGLWSEQAFEVTVANAAPAFGADAIERSVAENSGAGTAVGEPVTASDPDGDAVSYGIAAGGGGGLFEIGAASGRITVAQGAVLDYESGDTVYTVRVVASDGTLADTVAVTVRVTDQMVPGRPVWEHWRGQNHSMDLRWSEPGNGGSRITGYDRRHREKEAAGAWTEVSLGRQLSERVYNLKNATAYQAQVRARNIEGAGEWSDTLEVMTSRPAAFPADTVGRAVVENAPPGTAVGEPVVAMDPEYSLMGYQLLDGPPGDPFRIVLRTGQILVAAGAVLDHETDPEHVLRMTADDGGLKDTVVVTIRVTNVPAPGRPEAPVVTGGTRELSASWRAPANEGPEIANYDLRYRAQGDSAWAALLSLGAVLSHTVGELEPGTTYLVQVRAESSEGAGEWSDPGEGTTAAPANRAPASGATAFEREVAENSEEGTVVGEPVGAVDPDGTSPSYRFVVGGDEALFALDAETGRITVAQGAALDYESGDTLYTVTVEASDGELADTAAVTIRVTNADDPGTVTLSAEVARVGEALTATLMDQDGSRSQGKRRWWQRSDDGASSWTNIAGARTRFYTPVAADVGKYLRAVFTYADGHGSGKRAESAAVQVRAVNAAPVFGTDAYEREVVENAVAGTAVGEPVAAVDPDGTSPTYGFVPGGDEASFEIDDATGRITVAPGAVLDYESGDTLHAVTVEASDGELADTVAVTIRVTNADDPGKITLSANVARVGVQLTATLMDQDVSKEPSKVRRWQRSDDGASWTNIAGARTRFYTPAAADAGKSLRAVFTYADGLGPGKRAESAAVRVVGATTPVVSFGAEGYTASAGGSADVALLLSPAAAAALAIEVVAGDATHTVTLQPGESAQTFAVSTAGLSASDTVEVRFGTLPDGVVAGVPAETRVVVAAAGAADLVVPGPVVFEPGDSLSAFMLELPAETAPGRFTLGFGELPEAVSAGAAAATVDITVADDARALLDEAFDIGLAVFGRAVAEGARQAIGGRIDAVMRPGAGPLRRRGARDRDRVGRPRRRYAGGAHRRAARHILTRRHGPPARTARTSHRTRGRRTPPAPDLVRHRARPAGRTGQGALRTLGRRLRPGVPRRTRRRRLRRRAPRTHRRGRRPHRLLRTRRTVTHAQRRQCRLHPPVRRRHPRPRHEQRPSLPVPPAVAEDRPLGHGRLRQRRRRRRRTPRHFRRHDAHALRRRQGAARAPRRLRTRPHRRRVHRRHARRQPRRRRLRHPRTRPPRSVLGGTRRHPRHSGRRPLRRRRRRHRRLARIRRPRARPRPQGQTRPRIRRAPRMGGSTPPRLRSRTTGRRVPLRTQPRARPRPQRHPRTPRWRTPPVHLPCNRPHEPARPGLAPRRRGRLRPQDPRQRRLRQLHPPLRGCRSPLLVPRLRLPGQPDAQTRNRGHPQKPARTAPQPRTQTRNRRQVLTHPPYLHRAPAAGLSRTPRAPTHRRPSSSAGAELVGEGREVVSQHGQSE